MAYSDLIISEYIEGTSNNKALEFFNGTGAPVDLGAGGYNVQFFFNGSASAGLTINLTGTVAAGDVFVLAQSAANATILAQADQTNGAGWFNGDDAVVLRKGTTVLDVIGQIGTDPGSEWGSGLASTQDNTLQRKSSVTSGDTDGSNAFDPQLQWDGLATDIFSGLGSYVPSAGGSVLVSLSALDASASEAGPDAGSWRFTRTGDTTSALTVNYTVGGTAGSGDYTPALSGQVVIPAGAATVDVSITPVDDGDTEGSETVTLTLVDGATYDLGATASASVTIADNDTAPTKISAIQGSGATTPLAGQTVTVEAIVVGDFQGSSGLSGFYLQEEDADSDGNAATSEGLFVFQGSNTTAVAVGDKVRVSGTVQEFTSGLSSLTQLTTLTSISVVSSGNPLPASVGVSFPLAGSLEPLEGMRVTISDVLTVTDTFTLGRFGEVLLSSNGPGNQPGTDARLDTYTQFNLPSASGYSAYLADIATRRIVLDDGASPQNRDPIVFGRDGNPLSASNTLRGGDTVASITGILDDRFGAADTGNYRIQPTAAVDFDATNPRSSTPPAVGGTIQVAAMNVLNYFNGPAFPTSRGADTQDELDRQLAKLVSAINGLGAEVVGLLELENDGYGSGSAIQSLVDALNAQAGAGTWAFINPNRPMGGDEIAVGLIYQPAAVTPVGNAAVIDKDVDARFNSDVQRPSLAQTFQSNETGATFTPVINHLKSKGSSAGAAGDADSGDGQGLSNATRTAAAEALVDWLATNPTGHGGNGYLVLGDLNAYAQEDPLRAIEEGADDVPGSADDFANLVADSTYSYSFDGQWGALDHALANGGLAGLVAGADKWHINADEPTVLDYNVEFKTAGHVASLYAPDAFRSSDHDPVLVGLNLGQALTGTSRGELIEGTDGPDLIRAGQGRDAANGGAGNDRYVFSSLLDFFDTIGDFAPGQDRLDISALMNAVGAGNANPVSGGYLKTASLPTVTTFGVNVSVGYTLVLFDPDGQAGPADARPMVELIGVSIIDPAQLLAPVAAG